MLALYGPEPVDEGQAIVDALTKILSKTPGESIKGSAFKPFAANGIPTANPTTPSAVFNH